MPGMIGPVSQTTLSACARGDRAVAAVRSVNEIFFHLDGRRVYYDSAADHLYFVDAPDGLVRQTLGAVLGRLRVTPLVEQMHLDPHGLFNGAHRVALGAANAAAVLVALRLAGVRAVIR